MSLALLFVVPILIVMPQLRYLVVRNAVVTAYFKSLRSPIDGDVAAITIGPGENARAGQAAMLISNPRIDRGPVARSRVMRDQVSLRLAAQREVVAGLERLSKVRKVEMKRYAESMIYLVDSRRRVLVERTRPYEALVTEATNKVKRARPLNSQGALSTADLEAAEAKYHDAVAQLAENALELERLGRQLEDLGKGIFQIDQPEGALHTQILDQEIQLKLITEVQELHRLETLLQVTQAELAGAEEYLSQQSEASVKVPAGMTVWHTDVTVGSSVTAGTKLLSYVDCSKLMVDIAIDDATLELIKPGYAVRIRLFGRPGYIEGTVRLVRGSGGLENSDDLAATVQDRGVRSGRVLADLNDPAFALDPGRACGIGRSAYAEFKDVGFLESIFIPLLR